MTAETPAPAVFTPAEVAAQIGSTEFFVRDLARKRLVPHLRVGRNAIRFTSEQAAAVREHLTQTTEAPVASLTTARSRARSRS